MSTQNSAGNSDPSPAAATSSDTTNAILPSDDDPSDYRCSICMDLLYKPCVNACGHAFCFWCTHRAMDALKSSHACPLCRAPFRHLPAVCIPLHSFLALTFPDETRAREEETRALEREEYLADSPAVVVEDDDGGFDVRRGFECVDCRGLAFPPTVLTCGHVACCGGGGGGGGEEATGESKGRVHRRRRRTAHCPVDGCVGRMASEGGTGSSACAMAERIIVDRTSEEERREAADASARSCGGLLDDSRGGVASSFQEGRDASTASPGGGGGETPSSFEPGERAILTGLAGAVRSRLNGTVATVDSFCATTGRYAVRANRLEDGPPAEEGLLRVEPRNLMRCIHYGAGCDGCGVFPIVGRRRRCLDCSEEIGFDLCGECYDGGVHERPIGGDDGENRVAAGRFNQQHRPEHVMEEMEVDELYARLQWMQSDNPGFSMEQVFGIMNGRVDF